MWIKCSENFVVNLVVNFVGSSNCSRIDKADDKADDKVYDKANDKVSFLMQSKQSWALAPRGYRCWGSTKSAKRRCSVQYFMRRVEVAPPQEGSEEERYHMAPATASGRAGWPMTTG